MKETKRKQRVAIALTVLAVAAGTAATWHYASRDEAVVEIETAALTRGSVVDSVGAVGTLEAVSTLLVGTQVTGRVQELDADFNSIVRKGQLLARIDPSLYEAQLEQAQANLASAEAGVERLRVTLEDAERNFARARDLAARRIVAQAELDSADSARRSAEAQVKSAEAQVAQARASVNQARLNLQKTAIYSPIDGIVISRDVDVGQTVSASTQAPTLFQLAAGLARMRVNTSVDESDIGRLRKGQKATFRVDAFPDREFEGVVEQVRLQPVVEQNVVTYAVLIDVSNPELMLRPGMSTNVTIEVARHDDVLRVSNAAVRFSPNPETYALLGQARPEPAQDRPGSAFDPSLRPASLSTSASREGLEGEAGTNGDRPAVVNAQSESTADLLFEPVAPVESNGRVWVVRDGQLFAVPVKTGLSDGLYTEVRAEGLEEGMEVVVAVREVENEIAASRTVSSPFLQQPPGRPPAGFR
ncbi:MAG: efflux RND transporter periplasmic adaptor subunit [Vicinamibacterales bacterium]